MFPPTLIAHKLVLETPEAATLATTPGGKDLIYFHSSQHPTRICEYKVVSYCILISNVLPLLP